MEWHLESTTLSNIVHHNTFKHSPSQHFPTYSIKIPKKFLSVVKNSQDPAADIPTIGTFFDSDHRHAYSVENQEWTTEEGWGAVCCQGRGFEFLGWGYFWGTHFSDGCLLCEVSELPPKHFRSYCIPVSAGADSNRCSHKSPLMAKASTFATISFLCQTQFLLHIGW